MAILAAQSARCYKLLWNYGMLEIQGAYTKNEDSVALEVLAQFDNGILHVWHQSEPFYHLLSCSDFSISASLSDQRGTIKLKTGGSIETSDLEILKIIKNELEGIDHKKSKIFFRSHELILLIAMVSLFFSIWFLASSCP